MISTFCYPFIGILRVEREAQVEHMVIPVMADLEEKEEMVTRGTFLSSIQTG